ncbi:hypothetical protein Ancab_030486 [Ancistrocladus abbreviatus]
MPTEELQQKLIGTGSSEGSKGISNLKLTTTQQALNDLDKVLNLLPNGATFVFTTLLPLFSNNGQCELVSKILTAILIVVCGFSCALASFTDSYTDKNGNTHYGIVTIKGLWTFDNSNSDNGGDNEAAQYKLQPADFVHAVLSLLVFAVVTLLNSDIVHCFCPSLEAYMNSLMKALPVVVSTVASLVFKFFPVTRRGIGSNPNSSNSGQSTRHRSEMVHHP